MYYVKGIKDEVTELSNGGLIGAFSSASGKADTVMDTNGQILYYNNGRQRLPKEDNDDVLQLKSGLPSWQPLSSSGGAYTLIETKTVSGSTTSSITFSLSPAIAPPNAVFVTLSGTWDDSQELGIQLNALTGNYTQYGAIYKPSALSAIAQTGEDHFDFVDNNMSDDELGFAFGLYRANPVTEELEGLSQGGGNKGWISLACHNTTSSQSNIDEVKINTLSGSAYIGAGTEISVYKLSGS